MRVFASLLLGLSLLTAPVFASPDVAGDNTSKQKYDYQVSWRRLLVAARGS